MKLFASLAAFAVAISTFGIGTPHVNAQEVPDHRAVFVEFDQNKQTFGIENVRVMDIQQLRTHKCYNAIGIERQECLLEFGIENLSSYVDNELFFEPIRQAIFDDACTGLTGEFLIDCENTFNEFNPGYFILLPRRINLENLPDDIFLDSFNYPFFESADDAEDEDSLSGQMGYRERSDRLWEVCERSPRSQTICFQNFFRYIENPSIDFDAVESAIFGDPYFGDPLTDYPF